MAAFKVNAERAANVIAIFERSNMRWDASTYAALLMRCMGVAVNPDAPIDGVPRMEKSFDHDDVNRIMAHMFNVMLTEHVNSATEEERDRLMDWLSRRAPGSACSAPEPRLCIYKDKDGVVTKYVAIDGYGELSSEDAEAMAFQLWRVAMQARAK